MRHRRWSLVAVALAVLGLVRGASGAEDLPALFAALAIDAPARPVPAPPLTLPDLDGKPHTLGDNRGRAVLLYFWTTW